MAWLISDVWGLLPLAVAVCVSFAGCRWYFRHASVHGPYAVPNYRSLHQQVIPRGGGIVVAIAVLAGLAPALWTGAVRLPQLGLLLAGGAVMAIVGVADDRLEIAARYRLALQIVAASSLPLGSGVMPRLDLGFAVLEPAWAVCLVSLPAVVWFYNLFNFVDGTDGMAAAATVFLSATMGVVLWLKGQGDLALVLGLLAAASAVFLRHNWPPARMFMGDAGTSFIAYALSVVMWFSTARDASVLWLWLVTGTAYFSDTTTTTFTRLLTVPNWYAAHRSHAYQNLARIWNSHGRILGTVLAINLLWVLPWVVVVFRQPAHAVLLTLIAYVPVVLVCLRFGPRFENK